MTVFSVTGGAPLRGRLRVPGDKSISHRALLLAALAEGTSTLTGLSDGDDVRRTRLAVEAMGAVVEGNLVTGGRDALHEPARVLEVGNSGTSIRLLAGMCASFPWLSVLAGDESVARRPMDRVAEPLRAMGATVDGREGGRFPPLVVRGGALRGTEHRLTVASAQVKSAILLAGLVAGGETLVHEPAPTRAHTEELLAECGADIEVDGLTVRLRPSALQPFSLAVPGDPSQAAFWLVAASIVPGSEVVVEDVYLGPARGAFVDVLRRMGGDLDVTPAGDGHACTVTARHAELRGTEIGGEEVPGLIDEIPILAVAAATATGPTVFRDAGELRVKESDRVATVVEGLTALGAGAEGRPDGLVVAGGADLRGGRVRSHGDHRVAMAMAVAGLAAEGETVIDGWEAVATSYPGFEEDLRRCAS